MTGWSLEYSFEVDIDRAIILEQITGSWKKDTAKRYHEDFMEEVQPLLGKPWAKLVDLRQWKTSYPDMVAVIGRHLSWCKNNNLALAVNVLNNPSTFRQLNEMFPVGKVENIEHIFRSMEEAEKFMAENWYNKVHQ